MMKEKMNEAINRQINEEAFSSYLYLSMSAWFERQNLKGFANWMKVQAQEEAVHAKIFFDHIVERGGEVKLLAIAAPKTAWASPLEAFRDTLEHEKHITSCIHGLMDLAIEEKDHAGAIALQWFVTEQVEEEANAEELLAKVEMVGESKNGLFMMDRELGARVFKLPAGVTI
jgi:ferritin